MGNEVMRERIEGGKRKETRKEIRRQKKGDEKAKERRRGGKRKEMSCNKGHGSLLPDLECVQHCRLGRLCLISRTAL